MRLFGKTEKRGYPVSSADYRFIQGLGIDTSGLGKSELNEATFYTSLKILTDSVSSLPLKLFYFNEDKEEHANHHELYQLLSLRPNKNMSSADFWRYVEFQRAYEGHAVVVIERRPNGSVEALYPVPTQHVRIWVDNAGVFGSDRDIWFVITGVDGKSYKFKSSEVLHFKSMSRDGVHGLSVRDMLRDNIKTANAGSQYTSTFFGDGLSVGGVLTYTGDISPEAMRKVKQKFEAMGTGVQNAGKILPIPMGFDFKSIRQSNLDADFVNISRVNALQIAAAFGVLPHHLNILDNSKYNNVSVLNDMFYRQTLLPILTTYEQELDYKLLTNQERRQRYGFKFNVDALLRSSLEERYEAYRIGIAAGFLTPNEVRGKENLPAIEGADTLVMNGSYVSIDDLGIAYESLRQGRDSANKEENNND